MEPIRQKAINLANDDTSSPSEMVMDYEAEGEKQVFDDTLEEILVNHPLNENVYEELVDDFGEFIPLHPDLLDQKQMDSEINSTDFSLVKNSNSPLKTMEESELNLEMSTNQSHILKKSKNIPNEILEVSDPRYLIDERNYELNHGNSIAETGLQSLVKESTSEYETDPILESFFHKVKSARNGVEISDKDFNKASDSIHFNTVSLEELAEFSDPVDLENMEKGTETFQKDSVNMTEKRTNYNEALIRQPEREETKLNPKLISKSDQDLQIKNNLSQDLSLITENKEENLQKNLKVILRNDNQDKFIETEKLGKEEISALKRVDIPLTSEKLKSTESINFIEKIQVEEVLKTEEKTLASERSKVTDKSLISEKHLIPEKISASDKPILSEKQFYVDKTVVLENPLTSEKPITLNKTTDFKGNHFSDVVENPDDSLSDGKNIFSEKSHLSLGDRVPESKHYSTNYEVGEGLKNFQKTKLEVGLQATEKFKLAEEFQPQNKEKTLDNLQIPSLNIKDISEKNTDQSMNDFRNFSSKDTLIDSTSFKSSDSIQNSGISNLTELSGVTPQKGVNNTSNFVETMRSADLPFNMEQIVSRVRILRGNGVEEMTLRLHPEELGQVTLKIRQSGADLYIDMRVDNSQAKFLVESGFDSLRSRFLDQEFSYQDLSLNVDINERESQFEDGRKNYKFEDDLNSVELSQNEESTASEEETPRLINRNESGLDLYV